MICARVLIRVTLVVCSLGVLLGLVEARALPARVRDTTFQSCGDNPGLGQIRMKVMGGNAPLGGLLTLSAWAL